MARVLLFAMCLTQKEDQGIDVLVKLGAEVDQYLPNNRPTPANVGRHLPTLGRIWPTSTNLLPKSANLGEIWAESRLPEQLFDVWARHTPEFRRCTPIPPKISPIPADTAEAGG